ncbi:NAD(P)-binding protein [Gonapodya prolifera JEL478]|uniref:NAD(P)-binding protein n=1 Tax=Gonapodya prolifera (strain JEL478) TaxID=1344416 RepID=A0A139A4P6_GONPJ|nr:NAD(P)-binding protein [Gonapodya prolifera JEL478]|eukprot:KXS11353.1 NAD(P)-binding protein [Gonapodya prolifera JEL478]
MPIGQLLVCKICPLWLLKGLESCCHVDTSAIVTGGASGIGAASAIRFAREGAKVVLTDLPSQSKLAQNVLQQIAAQGNALAFMPGFSEGFKTAIVLEPDVADESQWESVLKKVEETFDGPLDVLVNNARVGPVEARLEETQYEEWSKILRSALMGVPTRPSYTATKGGVRSISRSAAIYCAQSDFPGGKIRVNTVFPGRGQDETRKSHGTWGTPQDLANAITFLASEESSFITASLDYYVIFNGTCTYKRLYCREWNYLWTVAPPLCNRL